MTNEIIGKIEINDKREQGTGWLKSQVIVKITRNNNQIDQLKLNRKMSLVAEANLELHHKLNLYRAMKKLEYEAEAREIALAQSWQNSKTGRVDGRSWFDLYEEEKRVYRKLYYEFYNHKK